MKKILRSFIVLFVMACSGLSAQNLETKIDSVISTKFKPEIPGAVFLGCEKRKSGLQKSVWNGRFGIECKNET
ncbi:hypothetical protein [Flavobacterium sp. ACN6]|uniref:hypothetical protein n=1 Tax=Flavobacterium sp. ACN6 TaxID=1920426 RepID=UPI001D95D200|nr:hypothetical protein [Flavobacterium sp. ACN6]PBJ11786.1 hypothetical protein BSF42_25150 [Flavobacterium sp. ACN6]